jgi:hypothetical protein
MRIHVAVLSRQRPQGLERLLGQLDNIGLSSLIVADGSQQPLSTGSIDVGNLLYLHMPTPIGSASSHGANPEANMKDFCYRLRRIVDHLSVTVSDHSDVIWMLADDYEIRDGALAKIEECLEEDPRYVAVIPESLVRYHLYSNRLAWTHRPPRQSDVADLGSDMLSTRLRVLSRVHVDLWYTPMRAGTWLRTFERVADCPLAPYWLREYLSSVWPLVEGPIKVADVELFEKLKKTHYAHIPVLPHKRRADLLQGVQTVAHMQSILKQRQSELTGSHRQLLLSTKALYKVHPPAAKALPRTILVTVRSLPRNLLSLRRTGKEGLKVLISLIGHLTGQIVQLVTETGQPRTE